MQAKLKHATPHFNPQENYAIVPAKIVTIHKGKRLVQTYRSGERLKGRVIDRADYML